MTAETSMHRFLPKDARVFQILFLGSLLGLGAWLRDFSLRPEQVVLTFLFGVATQALGNRLTGRPGAGVRSALITCLSLSLLLRADNLLAHPAAAVLAISAKFLVRVRGKHVFNPGNLGVIAAISLLPGTWVSPGQWGHDFAFACWFVALGWVVTTRAARADVSWAFLAFWLGALALRVTWLGQSWAVWRHALENGSLLLFAFFMISDPMTMPNRRAARVAHALVVVLVAYAWQFELWRTNALLWALFLTSPLVPLWDRFFAADKYEWIHQGGSSDEAAPLPAPLGARAPRVLPRPAA